MAPGHSPEPIYTSAERTALLAVARASVETGHHSGTPLAVDPAEHPPALGEVRASFVTLRIDDELRGCTGRLEAEEPLVVDVARSAFGSAYRDSRFSPVSDAELPRLSYHVSVLSPPEPLPIASEAELLAALRPGVDGLVLRELDASATFLPAVWDSFAEPAVFLRELKRKAGLRASHWSSTLHFSRYTAQEIS